MKTLEAVCLKCSKATIANYRRGIQRLLNLISEKSSSPKTGGWLIKPELKKAFEKLPLSKRRSLSVAGLKASKMYGSDEAEKYWSAQMFKDSDEYQKQRAKNEKSPVPSISGQLEQSSKTKHTPPATYSYTQNS